ncbi:STAS domain-containing protein [Actinoplanes sp. URMC 104]|uniref:STAS domain-containing protein n=1 Tax=Actinoplanes sp. URMC 104 TaxID=3423409 RepID=UPI003F1AA54C
MSPYDPSLPGGLPERLLDLQVVPPAPTGPVRLVLRGELDREEADHLQDVFASVVRDHPGRPVELDAAALSFLDSTGIRSLLTCRLLAEQAGCRLTVVAVSRIAHEVLEVAGLLDGFDAPVPAFAGKAGVRPAV